MKKGRLSNDEARYITENAGKIPVGDIASYLDRDPTSVQSFMKKKLKLGLSDMEQAAYELEDRPYWKELESQFTMEKLCQLTFGMLPKS